MPPSAMLKWMEERKKLCFTQGGNFNSDETFERTRGFKDKNSLCALSSGGQFSNPISLFRLTVRFLQSAFQECRFGDVEVRI